MNTRSFIVALQVKSRYHRPAVHLFTYVEKFQRLAWRSEHTDDIGRLAELTNEALEFLRIQNNVDHVVEVVEVTNHLAQQPAAVSVPPAEQPPVESLPEQTPAPAAPQADLLPAEPPAPPKKRLQPRHP